jgi:undecaprenyl pyrophosphate phosphatase UppP
MADDHHDDSDLPATWPFRVAGTLLIAALSWFCLGFALEDIEEKLPAFYPVFWTLLVVGALLVLGGGLLNVQRERSRKGH